MSFPRLYFSFRILSAPVNTCNLYLLEIGVSQDILACNTWYLDAETVLASFNGMLEVKLCNMFKSISLMKLKESVFAHIQFGTEVTLLPLKLLSPITYSLNL